MSGDQATETMLILVLITAIPTPGWGLIVQELQKTYSDGASLVTFSFISYGTQSIIRAAIWMQLDFSGRKRDLNQNIQNWIRLVPHDYCCYK